LATKRENLQCDRLLITVEKNSKTISHFCGLFGWLLGQLRFYKKFQKTKILGNLGSLGEEFYKGKRKREPGQRVECTLFHFILFSIV
jgi:hypothetical protein